MTFKMIYKDFMSNKKLFVWWFAYIIIFSFVFSTSFGNSGGFMTIAIFVSYLVTGSILQNDEKFRANMLIGVLPVKRSAVIGSKFILSNLGFAAVLLVFGIFMAVERFVPVLHLTAGIDFTLVAVSFFIASLFTSVSILICYKFDATKARVILMIIMVFLIGAGAGTLPLLLSFMPAVDWLQMMGIFALAGGILVQILGYLWSVHIYNNKDF